jgi:hypothetical protein
VLEWGFVPSCLSPEPVSAAGCSLPQQGGIAGRDTGAGVEQCLGGVQSGDRSVVRGA